MKENDFEDTEELKRFQKPERLIDKVVAGSEEYMTKPFLALELDSINKEIDQWLEIALINDRSYYETGQTREDLIDFCRELQLLAEAFHVISAMNKPEEANAWKTNLPPDLKAEMDEFNQPEFLTPEQAENPMSVVHDFCNHFTLTYCRAEIWDLLNAVITYEGERKVVRINLLLIYECISSIIEVAYKIIANNG